MFFPPWFFICCTNPLPPPFLKQNHFNIFNLYFLSLTDSVAPRSFGTPELLFQRLSPTCGASKNHSTNHTVLESGCRCCARVDRWWYAQLPWESYQCITMSLGNDTGVNFSEREYRVFVAVFKGRPCLLIYINKNLRPFMEFKGYPECGKFRTQQNIGFLTWSGHFFFLLQHKVNCYPPSPPPFHLSS